ncbi:MAG: dihydrodipicolinate synthase family protein, partial [Acidobacteria bacterium]|nr:dihydrodipicolinate synthase family protein [Acidobacteriota bacterium]
VETVCEAVAGRAPVIAGVSGHSTPAAAEALRELRHAPVDGFVSSTPYFMSYSQPELAGHFQALAETAGGPVILYNYPGRYRHLIEIATIRLLLEQGAAFAIKDTDGDFDYMLRLLELKRQFPDFLVFEGALQNLARAGRLGIDGSVQVIANLWPEECASLWRQLQLGQWESLEADVNRLWKFHQDMEAVLPFIRSLKGCMALRGFSSATPVPPMQPADPHAAARLRALMDDAYPHWREA